MVDLPLSPNLTRKCNIDRRTSRRFISYSLKLSELSMSQTLSQQNWEDHDQFVVEVQY